MKILNFYNYIKEDKEEDDIKSTDTWDANEYEDLQEEISEMIKKSLKSEDEKVFNDFLDGILARKETSNIEELINILYPPITKALGLDMDWTTTLVKPKIENKLESMLVSIFVGADMTLVPNIGEVL